MVHFLTHTIHFGLLRNHEAPVMLALIFGTSPSSFRHTPILRKQHESINYGQENAGTSCSASITGSDDVSDFTIMFCIPRNPFLRKWHKSCNYGKENSGTSCLASKTRSEAILNFTIAFSIPINPYPEKTA